MRLSLEERFRQLASGETLLDDVLSEVPDHIYVYDRGGHYRYVCPSACKTLRLAKEEMLGKTWRELGFPEEIMTRFDTDRLRVFQTGETLRSETHFPVGDEIRCYEYILSPIRSSDRSVEMVVAHVRDITERRSMEETIKYMAAHDPLTELFNRREMDRLLAESIERANRYRQSLSILMIDIDHFKQINDTYGHPVGDRALCHFSALLKRVVRNLDYVGRYGGEEFLVILPDTDLSKAEETALRIHHQIGKDPLIVDPDKRIRLQASTGIAGYPDHGSSGEALIRAADRAMYSAKGKEVPAIRQATNVPAVDLPGKADRPLP